MLQLARSTLQEYLASGKVNLPDPQKLSSNLTEKRPCFVTLMKRGSGLRGCIGLFEFDRPLYKNIIERSVLAATQDGRFDPVKAAELKEIKIEISILTEPKEIPFSTTEYLLSKLRPFTDGVILHTTYGVSTYLPQVWEQLPDKEEFLGSLCEKQGSGPDCWRIKDKNLKIETYQAIHFQEVDYGGEGKK